MAHNLVGDPDVKHIGRFRPFFCLSATILCEWNRDNIYPELGQHANPVGEDEWSVFLRSTLHFHSPTR